MPVAYGSVGLLFGGVFMLVAFGCRSAEPPGAAAPGASGAGGVRFLDDVRGSLKLFALACGFFVASAVMLPALLFYAVYEWSAWLLAVMFLAVGGGLLLQMLPRFRRRNTPYLVITPMGFRCPGLADGLVPWAGVEHAVVSDDPIVCTDLFFKPDLSRPPSGLHPAFCQSGGARRRVITTMIEKLESPASLATGRTGGAGRAARSAA